MERRLSAAAKVNLNLRILGRYENGYHQLRSLVAFADFGDDLWIETGAEKDEILWETSSIFTGEEISDNILWRVLSAAQDCISLPHFRIRLLKRIPMGSGLGGGSADAAALLGYLIRDYGLSQTDAYRIADDLGSDIRVCMQGRACWLGGVGDEIVSVQDFPKAYVLLTWGLEALKTADVFKNFAGDYSADYSKLPLSFTSFNKLTNFLHLHGGNDLWNSAAGLCSDLTELRDRLSNIKGAAYVGMSGSGSTMFGLFNDHNLCTNARDTARDLGYKAIVCKLV